MIVSCEKCGTKFRLDDGAVEPGGTKVRCSLCKHVFTVYPPGPAGDRRPEPVKGGEKAPEAVQKEPDARSRVSVGSVEDFEDFMPEFDDAYIEDGLADFRKRQRTATSEQDSGRVYPASKQKEKRPFFLWRILRVFSLLVVFIAVIVAALYYWAPEVIEDGIRYIRENIPAAGTESTEEKPDADADRLVLSNVAGNFVDSGTAGNLFVIRGSVQNKFPGARSFIQLQGNILDDRGMAVLQRKAYAGNPLTDAQLSEMSTEEIALAMNNREGVDGMNVDIPSGASVPFTIVFEELPENVVEFTVEAVRSVPGNVQK